MIKRTFNKGIKMPDRSFDLVVFGRMFRVERTRDNWELMVIGRDGKFSKSEDILIPSFIREHEIRKYLEDILHEYSP
ncbi:MAG: hypothetical protein JW971_04705 [Synergistales bacterium]|nr:hypothetical protein [Synergistales bacterium]